MYNKIKTIIFTFILMMGFVSVNAAEVEKIADTNKTWNGAEIKSINIENPHVTALSITIKAGEKLAIHEHPVLNLGYMVSGELTVVETKTGKKKHLKAGDSLVEVIDTWHYGVNNSDSDSVIVVFYVGEKGQPLTIKK